jgi:hypothetical protein
MDIQPRAQAFGDEKAPFQEGKQSEEARTPQESIVVKGSLLREKCLWGLRKWMRVGNLKGRL